MKEEKRPFSVTPSPEIPEPTEIEKIKAKMLSDVAVALIGCCDAYPDASPSRKADGFSKFRGWLPKPTTELTNFSDP